MGIKATEPDNNCFKVGTSQLNGINCVNIKDKLRGICQYRECITDESRLCSFPFRYKGRMYDSCITIDSTVPWCSLLTDIQRNHLEGVGTQGICPNTCNVQNCPVGFYNQDQTCIRISARTDHDSWVSTAQAEEQCMKAGARLYQPRDVKSYENLLAAEFEHLKPNKSHFLHNNKSSFIALGARSLDTSSSLVYLDGSRAYMLETVMKEESSFSDIRNEECIFLMQSGSLTFQNCNDYFNGLKYKSLQIGYICEAKTFVTIGGNDTGNSCIFPFKESDDTPFHTSCLFDDVRGSWCATEVNKNGVVLDGRWGLCQDERRIAFKGPGSGKECILPFVYNGIWRDTCILKPRTAHWCPTSIKFNKTYIEGQDELGFCTEHLIPMNEDCPESYDKVDNICVIVSPIADVYEAVQEKCTEEGGKLISILDKKLHLALVSYIQNMSLVKYYFNITTKITDYWIEGTVADNMLSGDLNYTINIDCNQFKCLDKYGLTMSVLGDNKWKAELKTSSRPFICESKCRVGYRWGYRLNKCINIINKLQGVSNAESMLSCAMDNSRLLSISSCEDFNNLTEDNLASFPSAPSGKEYWIGYFIGDFQNLELRKISKFANTITAINSLGLIAPNNCGMSMTAASLNNSAGFFNFDSKQIYYNKLSNIENLKGFICEEENDWMCPTGYILFQDECFMLMDDSAMFTEALINCSTAGGYLVEPKHELFINFLHALKKNSEVENMTFWTGYRRNMFNITDIKDLIFTTSNFKENDFPKIFGQDGM